ncbi:Hypothetical_protein [Hexamita inflata]|uniref:Hypothetical_protein n=1 Tax=Hexamita inflata TaxID=28002 RepID=A0AA86NHJ1_9EUKA|nr:Hypothetical protein HINF_LOCUS6863 [Hexamita inflata]
MTLVDFIMVQLIIHYLSIIRTKSYNVIFDHIFYLFNYALPLTRQSQDSYQPSQRQLQRQFPRSTMLVQVLNQHRLSEEVIQNDNPRRQDMMLRLVCGNVICNQVWICGL